MITGGREGAVQAPKESARIVRNPRRLAMHRRGGAHDVAAERLADRLMAETNTEHRRGLARGADKVETDARFVRRAGTRRKDDGVRLVGQRVRDRDLVVAPHGHVRAELAKVMDE